MISYICLQWLNRHDKETVWRHQMETFSALLVICEGNSPVTGEFPSQRPVTRCFDVFFDLRLNKRLLKQSWDWWFETSSRSLWRHCNVLIPTCLPFYVFVYLDARHHFFSDSRPFVLMRHVTSLKRYTPDIWNLPQSSLRSVSGAPINNMSALVQIMIWHWSVDKQSSEPHG